MEPVYVALRYSEWALEFMIVPPLCFAFGFAAISLVWAGLKQRRLKTRLWKPYYWLFAAHLLFFVAAITVGVLMANPITNPSIPHHAERSAKLLLDAVTYCSIASCGFWIWRMKGIRWFAASLMALAELVTWGAFVVAGMSISGDWL